MKQIRVLLIEDHFLARMALHSVLSGHSQIRIIGEACDGEAGIAMYRQHRPDVVVLDLRLPRISGFDVITELRKEFPGARIVVLSNYRGSEDIYRAVRSGAMAYLTKDASGEELLNAIQNVDRGLRYLPHVALDRLAERADASGIGGLSLYHPGEKQPRNRGRASDRRKNGSNPREFGSRQDGSPRSHSGDDLCSPKGTDSPRLSLYTLEFRGWRGLTEAG